LQPVRFTWHFLVLFQNQKHFGFNRIYLPVSMLLSFLIPLITFTTVKYIEPPKFDYNSFAYLPENSNRNCSTPF
jgi:bla regulator protein blaR1